ncbi:16S rRNA (guanine(527)-N(7))-methyltransferase RsmG [Dasania sp. GY-MA-18]|uniref:Ribosomal RNA small subunit methyltransferase G n=1 Tax=Dasania phycosphaerae TaxID=2950436 RepID=A0A9J6RK91_9GAMM|nr:MULTISPECIES: 16S rRNA (guanine(527)-N(7))-methyltransferase RsmG [Dasania]MCR8921977.1 16S rRNA (guanine(527)-N(7))-methyltransferase RsmG [Dasania sp. GY-MA-18]MCZ0864405.1 16S rRNA (guanine(527)-N(7))-methyltransferase RsmG [Dasania phycosphaerae]MCZ0868133.1 16S rRNA (guanine(527)-N(7))-methyltransferase RsmG [Dasania phycosphaerae]
MSEQYRTILAAGAEALGLTLDEKVMAQLLAYHQLLIKWNKAYNLTAIRDPLEMVSRHLLDSLSIATLIRGQRFIDVGTGGGLPGIVLAILYPERSFDLLDSNGKKTRFLFQVKTELKLANVAVHHCRVESHHPEQLYDGVLSRAFATLEDMVQGSQQLLADDGRFYAMKGVYPTEELSAVQKTYKVDACHPLDVPHSDGQRHLVVMSKQR